MCVEYDVIWLRLVLKRQLFKMAIVICVTPKGAMVKKVFQRKEQKQRKWQRKTATRYKYNKLLFVQSHQSVFAWFNINSAFRDYRTRWVYLTSVSARNYYLMTLTHICDDTFT